MIFVTGDCHQDFINMEEINIPERNRIVDAFMHEER